MRNQIVILAAGQGKRMGVEMPKVLVMLKDKPLILHLLHELEKITQLAKSVIVVGYKHKQVQAVLGEDFAYEVQTEQLGTGHALLCAKPKVIAENILVLYGDMPFIKAESVTKLLRLHQEKQAVVSMFTTKVPEYGGMYRSIEYYGRIIRNTNNEIVDVVEYKDATPEQREILESNPGIYIFNTKWLWENLKKVGNSNQQHEYYLTDVIKIASEQGIKIAFLEVNPQEVLGINTPEDLAIAESLD